MANLTVKNFTSNGTWVAPAGVKKVTVLTTKNPNPYAFVPGLGGVGIIDGFNNLYVFGYNATGSLGVGDVTNRSIPVTINGAPVRFVKAIMGSFMMAMSDQGILYTCGDNTDGQLGTNNVTALSTPVIYPGAGTYKDFLIGDSTNSITPFNVTYALGLDGTGYATGTNPDGLLATGDTVQKSNATIFAGSVKLEKFVGLGVGLGLDGLAYCWGSNSFGQVGDGTTTNRSSPVPVAGGRVFRDLFGRTTAFQTSGVPCPRFGITSTGLVYAWGANSFGELGVGDTVGRSSPTLMVGGLSFAQIITARGGSNYGLTSAGVLYAWGNNTNGQLGDNTVVAKSSPVLVLGSHVFSKVVTADGATIGLDTAGNLYAWGLNTRGQLGDGTAASRSTPTLVVGGKTWVDFNISLLNTSSNVMVSMGITSAGDLYAWGCNDSGQIGDNTTVDKSSPVLIYGGHKAWQLPTKYTTDIDVVPGTSYTVTVNNFFAQVGSSIVGRGRVDSLALKYLQ